LIVRDPAPIMRRMPSIDDKRDSAALGPVPRTSCTCGSLRKASRRISQFYDAALSPIGIKSTQYSILSEIERGSVEGPVTICELAIAMVMDRSTLGHNLRPLQRDRLLVLRLEAHDRRKRYVELTREGRSILRKARRIWKQAEGRFEKTFGRERAADLRTVLWHIANNQDLKSLLVADGV
jgi:DNA-binding MarR family transcriptional regulator